MFLCEDINDQIKLQQSKKVESVKINEYMFYCCYVSLTEQQAGGFLLDINNLGKAIVIRIGNIINIAILENKNILTTPDVVIFGQTITE